MQEQAAHSNVLETIFSVPGAVITICITVIFVLCLLAVSPRLRDFLRGVKIKLGSGSKQFEISPADQPSQELAAENRTASIKPPAAEEIEEKPELRGAAPTPDELPLDDDDELSLRKKMYIAAFADKDSDKLETTYQKLKSLQDGAEHVVRAEGTLTIGGVTRPVSPLLNVTWKGDHWTVEQKEPLHVLISDYLLEGSLPALMLACNHKSVGNRVSLEWEIQFS